MRIEDDKALVDSANDPFVRAAIMMLTVSNIDRVEVKSIIDRGLEDPELDLVIYLTFHGIKATVPANFCSPWFLHKIGFSGDLPYDDYDELLDALRDLFE
jgi:hypothetical protein